MITLWVGFVVSEFQPRGLLHEHQIYAPKSDPHHDMHIHYHLQCPIYMICDVFGFGHKFLGHYESQLDNFMVEGMCWDDCLYNSFVIGIFAALKKDFSVWMLSSKSIWFFESSVVSMSCHRNRGSLHGKNKKETIKGIDPILVSYYKILSQKKKKNWELTILVRTGQYVNFSKSP